MRGDGRFTRERTRVSTKGIRAGKSRNIESKALGKKKPWRGVNASQRTGSGRMLRGGGEPQKHKRKKVMKKLAAPSLDRSPTGI